MNTPLPAKSQLWAWGIVSWLLGASFTFYVTFVQYALLGRATGELQLREEDLTIGFGLLALLGIAGSLLAGYWIDRKRARPGQLVQATAYLSGAVALCAVLAMQAPGRWTLTAVFAPMGLALGLLIVVLLFLFLSLLPFRVRGIFAGFTAAIVYLMANVLALFTATPDKIGLFDLGLMLGNVALALVFYDILTSVPAETPGGERPLKTMPLRLWPLAAVVLIDTALFVQVSRAPGQWPVYSTAHDWLSNGLFHFLVAAFAGLLYARMGWLKLTKLAAVALALTLGLFVAHRLGAADLAKAIIIAYSLTVGLYTVALFTVFGEETSRARPATGIAWGMCLVGWICSPAGIALGTALL